MDDLVEFLRARLDEDEQVARAAAGRNWLDGDGWLMNEDMHIAEVGDRPTLVHIAAHDPARVLREVEAGRRLIRAHAKWCEGRCEAKYPEGGFDAAHYWNIKVRAEVYSDRPGYRPEWRP
ncbi:DUF6221 family protein [Streptomyces misionensis]|uniref:DUF6221 family protein n=1 Tax=Streptomyces misionensis TaxID=67331 RepID=UPI0034288DB0